MKRSTIYDKRFTSTFCADTRNRYATATRKKERRSTGEQREVRWVQIRLIPIWLRIVIILILVVVAAALGAMFGFSVIGEGNAMDIFKRETWRIYLIL